MKEADSIVRIFLGITFLFIVFLFSHIYFPFLSFVLYDSFSDIRPGFEIWKVYVFLFGTMPLIAYLLVNYKKISFKSLAAVLSSVFCLFLLLSSLLSGKFSILDFGSEKSHTLSFWLALLVWLSVLRLVKGLSYKTLRNIATLSCFGLLLYGILQNTYANPSIANYVSYVSLDRIISTLGNANYVAGFGLMCLPIFLYSKSLIARIVSVFFSLMIIILSGSLIAYVLAFVFVLYCFVQKYVPRKKKLGYLIMFIVCIFIILVLWKIFPDKWNGIYTRYYLILSGIRALGQGLIQLIFGYGPEGFSEVYPSIQHPGMQIYSDPSLPADRVHNIFLDIWLQLGLVPLLCIVYYFSQRFKVIPIYSKQSIVLGVLYFSLNIPVLVHYLLFLFLISLEDE